MADRPVIIVFCEDRGHEYFVRPLIRRLSTEAGVPVDVVVASAQGGKGTAINSLRRYQRIAHPPRRRDCLIVVIDSNSDDWHTKRRAIEREVDPTMWPRHVIGCPEPHIERWCFADVHAFQKVVGVRPPTGFAGARGADYKRIFRDAVRAAGVFIVADPMELAEEIVSHMQWPNVSHDRSFDGFVGDLRTMLQSLHTARP